MRALVLAYHSHNVFGRDYGRNDHVALAADLEAIHASGAQVAPLREIASRMGEPDHGPLLVGLSFDDGPVFDCDDFEHPQHGPQRGFLNILRDFRERHGGAAQPGLHATSFVIASPEARRAMERSESCGYTYLQEWLDERWWTRAMATGLIEIGNHSWDHVHHAVPSVATAAAKRDDFTVVASHAEADREIRHAADYIRSRVGRCELFAYPFGHVNQFLAGDYLPRRALEHGMTAAFGAGGGVVTSGTSRWNIPRCVCGDHWRSPGELAALLRQAAG